MKRKTQKIKEKVESIDKLFLGVLLFMLVISILVGSILFITVTDSGSEKVVVKDSEVDTDSKTIDISLESSDKILSSGETFVIHVDLLEKHQTMMYNPATRTMMPTTTTNTVSTKSKETIMYKNEVKSVKFNYETDRMDDYRISVEKVER